MGATTVHNAVDQQHIAAMFERNASSLAALIVLCYECFANMDDEARYIWRGPINRVKSIYLVARYLALSGLIVNAILLFKGPLSVLHVHASTCRAWFTMLTVISCFVLFAIDAIAMLRVYALYNRDIKIGAFFSSVLLTEATLVTTCSSRTIGVVPFSPICDVDKTPLQVVYFMGGVIFAQCSLLFFTFLKRREMVGQRHIPIIRLVFREGAWMSTLICCIFFFTVPYSLITGTSKPHLVLVWPTALVSIAACRVILNLHRLSVQGQSTRQRTRTSQQTDTDIQFTSFFDLSQGRTFDSRPSRGSSQGYPPQTRSSPTARESGSYNYDQDLIYSEQESDKASTLSSLSLTLPSSLSSSRLPPIPPPSATHASGILLRPDEAHGNAPETT